MVSESIYINLDFDPETGRWVASVEPMDLHVTGYDVEEVLSRARDIVEEYKRGA